MRRSAATGLVPVERTFLHYFTDGRARLCLDAPTPEASVRRDRLGNPWNLASQYSSETSILSILLLICH